MNAETPMTQDMPAVPDYVARARALRKLITAAAPEIEAAGELSEAVVAALHEAQLFRLHWTGAQSSCTGAYYVLE